MKRFIVPKKQTNECDGCTPDSIGMGTACVVGGPDRFDNILGMPLKNKKTK